MPIEHKLCRVCGRAIEWRKRWRDDWDHVKYCSRACRSSRNDPALKKLEAAILELLARRQPGASICPSEVAREHVPEGWRDWMEPVRRAARRLVMQGRLEMTQRGLPVDPATVRGPVRLRLPR